MEALPIANELEERVIQINRVSKKTKGGNRIAFSVLAVVGDRRGRVGAGLGKALEVPAAVAKAVSHARKNLITVPGGGRFARRFLVKRGAAKILFKPAPLGLVLRAGGPVRAVLELGGLKGVSAKVLGTKNKASNVYATLAALQNLN